MLGKIGWGIIFFIVFILFYLPIEICRIFFKICGIFCKSDTGSNRKQGNEISEPWLGELEGSLEENLGLPKIGGQIIAQHRRIWDYKTKRKVDNFFWVVRFVIPGPDARYNPGAAWLPREGLEKLVVALEKALKETKFLESQSGTETYAKAVNFSHPRIRIEVKANKGKIWAVFWVSSKTFKFSRLLSSSEVEITIDKLRTVEQQGEEMIRTLKAQEAALAMAEKEAQAPGCTLFRIWRLPFILLRQVRQDWQSFATRRKVPIMITFSIIMLWVCAFMFIIADTAVREIGLLPTYTPGP